MKLSCGHRASETRGSGTSLAGARGRVSPRAAAPLPRSAPAPSNLSELLVLGVLKLERTGRRDATNRWLEHRLRRGAWEAARDERPDAGLDTAFNYAIAKCL